jgi:lysophospholipase L1-like esterase
MLWCQADGANRWHLSLPPGLKTVELVTGLTSLISSVAKGTYLTGVGFGQSATLQVPSAAGRILVYGDSIAVGDTFATAQAAPQLTGWTALLRGLAGGVSVAVEAQGRRALYDDASAEPTYSNWLDAMADYNPAIIWMAIGTNDYGRNLWTAANFGGAYAVVLDDLHAAVPGAAIYAQTPLLRTVETANGLGSTLGNYRTQIATAVSTRTAFCTLVDGTAILATGDLASDGIHPTIAGHALYAAYVAAELGF